MSDELAGVDRCPHWPRGHLDAEPILRSILGISTHAFREGGRLRPNLVHGAADRWADVFSLDAAQRLIDSGTLLHPHFEYVRAGALAQDLAISHLQGGVARRALGKGYTVLIRALDRIWPGVRDLAVRLSSALEEEVNVNAYLTPDEQVGVPRHDDPHDVIVLQLHGRKHWRIFDDSGGPAIETSLAPGDALYVPRGWAHQPQAQTLSLHLTIGLVGPAREALDEVADGVHAKRLARSQTCPPPAAGLGAHPDPPGLDDKLARPLPLFAAALERCARTALVFGGRRVTGPERLRDAFRFVADHATFPVSALPGDISDAVRRELAGRLVAEGLLTVDRTST